MYVDGDWLLQNIHLVLFEKDLYVFVLVAQCNQQNLEFNLSSPHLV